MHRYLSHPRFPKSSLLFLNTLYIFHQHDKLLSIPSKTFLNGAAGGLPLNGILRLQFGSLQRDLQCFKMISSPLQSGQQVHPACIMIVFE